MPRIEDYGLIGDCLTAALVGRNGSIDWLCLPHFDGGACFASLLGDSSHGRWLIAPAGAVSHSSRAYRGDTLILETVFETGEGSVALIDFMVPGSHGATLVRLVEGRRGTVAMSLDLALRFDYGASVPWVEKLDGRDGIRAIAGPDLVVLRSDVALHGRDMRTVADFTVEAGQTRHFVLQHGPSHRELPKAIDTASALAATEGYWRDFLDRCVYRGRWTEAVRRSLLTLKALTYAPTGGIVAAPTTSLPEKIGDGRNWDYRYCWLRDATLTLFALMGAGFASEAAQWRDWLQRSIAGDPAQIQIMYGLHGERRLGESEIPWLPGYEGSAPVRVGNAAAGQVQLDVYGELLDCLHQARVRGIAPPPHGWALQRGIIEHLAQIWEQPDEGMWEVRGGARHFTFSKIMAWVAFDRMIKDATRFHLRGPVDSWCAIRDRIAETVLRDGYDSARNTFVQSFGAQGLDASLLLIPIVGFLPPEDARVRGTLAAIERELLVDGLVLRYRTEEASDGLPPGEGAFLACSFWLAQAYVLQGRTQDAEALFERLLALSNDLGLLSEEYDPAAGRMLGNFPQAFSHVALVGCAMALSSARHG